MLLFHCALSVCSVLHSNVDFYFEFDEYSKCDLFFFLHFRILLYDIDVNSISYVFRAG